MPQDFRVSRHTLPTLFFLTSVAMACLIWFAPSFHSRSERSSAEKAQGQLNLANVLVQRRDSDVEGFLFWLGQVNSGPLRDANKQNGMVCAFTTSAEYQQRFSSLVTHSNAECQ